MKRLILIADGGSTKTDWMVVCEGAEVARFTTSGLNPIVLGPQRVKELLASEVVPQLQALMETDDSVISDIRFYGAGCTVEQIPVVEGIFRELFPEVEEVTVDSDIIGAALALCGHRKGIAAILGTGANSCLWDGNSIVRKTPALGFILGDEGSGAVLGKLFINGILKGQLPTTIRDLYLSETGLSESLIIEKVYRQPAPNRFLASCSLFIAKHKDSAELMELVTENFRQFFRRNIKPYNEPELEVGFVGSMAFYYEEQLRRAAEGENIKIGKIMKSPLEGLIK